MKKIFWFLPFLLLNPSELFTSKMSVMANPNNCSSAILLAEQELNKARSVSVVRSRTEPHRYRRYPDARSQAHYFWIGGAGAANIMNSPIFMKNLSTQIISNCHSTGFVDFGVYQTDWGATFGITEDSELKVFDCIRPSRERSLRLEWGQRSCP